MFDQSIFQDNAHFAYILNLRQTKEHFFSTSSPDHEHQNGCLQQQMQQLILFIFAHFYQYSRPISDKTTTRQISIFQL